MMTALPVQLLTCGGRLVVAPLARTADLHGGRMATGRSRSGERNEHLD